MKERMPWKWRAVQVGALLGIAAMLYQVPWLVMESIAGSQNSQEYVLFGGSNIDSTENVSPWIPVRGANRVILRTWSGKAAWHISTDADSAFSDSIAVFRIGFSDSVSGYAGGSGSYPIAQDSLVVISATVNKSDTLFALAALAHAPVNRVLRAQENGSGVISIVFPTSPSSVGFSNTGTLAKQYMRVYVTPLRRSRATSWDATVPARVNGLKALRMRAMVIRDNK